MDEKEIEILKKRLLNLKDGWADCEENKAFSPDFINKIGKILQYISDHNLPFPTVGPSNTNCLDLFWKDKRGSMLINFEDEWGDIVFTGCLIEKNRKK